MFIILSREKLVMTNQEEECNTCTVEFSEEELASSSWKSKNVIIISISAVLFSIGLMLEFILKLWILAEVFFSITVIISGYSIAKEGFFSLLFRRRLSIDLLIIMAALGSFFIGHGKEGAAVVFLFNIAEFLEVYAGERAKRSIASLMKIAPEVATVKKDSKEVKVPVGEVAINEIIVIRPGEKIPLDGVVINGISSVDQSPITGESMPVTKQIGDEVYSGTINNEGFLEIKVTKRSNETLLSKIVKFVAEAQKKKSPTERFIDKFSKYYTPSVMLLALIVATIPTFVFGFPFNEWFYKALVLLVVSCPCALAISTPVAMVSAITSAARNGVLIKGSSYVEEVSKIKTFAFDKTGTLTEGKLEVTDIISLGESKESVLEVAASLEVFSEHPIAKAIIEKAKNEKVKLRSTHNFKAIAGKGVTGKIKGNTHYVGNRRLFKELKIDLPEEHFSKLENEGKIVIMVGTARKIMGLIAVMDKIRDATIETVHKLKEMGIKTVMITGDNERTAQAIAKRISISEYRAELLPEDKVKMVRKLANNHGHIAMVGDGVNDAPALASANVGIAMGAIGSDVSLETADIALMQDDLSKLPYLIRLSEKTLKIVKENVFASILIKGSFSFLVFPGLVTLWLAVAIGDMGLSLAVILNAMRLSRLKEI